MQVMDEMYAMEAGQLLFRFFFFIGLSDVDTLYGCHNMAAILTIACNVPMAAMTIHPEGVIFW